MAEPNYDQELSDIENNILGVCGECNTNTRYPGYYCRTGCSSANPDQGVLSRAISSEVFPGIPADCPSPIEYFLADFPPPKTPIGALYLKALKLSDLHLKIADRINELQNIQASMETLNEIIQKKICELKKPSDNE